MGYVAVKGGTKAIEESINRLKYERVKTGKILDVDNILAGMYIKMTPSKVRKN